MSSSKKLKAKKCYTMFCNVHSSQTIQSIIERSNFREFARQIFLVTLQEVLSLACVAFIKYSGEFLTVLVDL